MIQVKSRDVLSGWFICWAHIRQRPNLIAHVTILYLPRSTSLLKLFVQSRRSDIQKALLEVVLPHENNDLFRKSEPLDQEVHDRVWHRKQYNKTIFRGIIDSLVQKAR